MKVSLLNHTPRPLQLLYTAARTCYSPGTPSGLWNESASRGQKERLIRHIFESGHHSILEHVSFAFAIEGISRACSHQLVRHRLASYSQQSQRYVEGPFAYVTPASWKKAGEEMGRRYEQTMTDLDRLYQEALVAGVPAEDARFVLPNATTTNLTMTMNLRELLHAVGIRTCVRAQWEIRKLFNQVRRVVEQADAFLGSFLMIKCDHLGYCDERESCGRYPLRSDVIVPAKEEPS